ncbi:MAG: CARDB domain-containing protein [Candidatus Omnitrophota bacterium]
MNRKIFALIVFSFAISGFLSMGDLFAGINSDQLKQFNNNPAKRKFVIDRSRMVNTNQINPNQINVSPQQNLPDLQIAAIQFNQDQLVEGFRSVGVLVVFSNRGRAAVERDWHIQAEISGNDLAPQRARSVVEVAWVNQQPGAIQLPIGFSIPIGQPIARGRYDIKVTLDCDNVIAESDESNNERVVSIDIRQDET